ncbi:hypothetical protein [Candidatus Neptunochlamydia vexilliferae]|uniref:hypothetical protein n=1 Tax=Candidatus Neptunichlamydia vexilliferae TaxID=1651774 RepID=UPI0018917DB7|nr:hypothetical protein [Candidatus Neptunochlamydia vexilliferae]
MTITLDKAQQSWTSWIGEKVYNTVYGTSEAKELDDTEFTDLDIKQGKIVSIAGVKFEEYTPKYYQAIELSKDFFNNRAAFQTVLAPFYGNSENITLNNLFEFITAYNETYPKTDRWNIEPIDLDKDSLSELVRVVGSMIVSGEDTFLYGIGHYNIYAPSLTQKVIKYREDRSLVGEDIAYQRIMLGLFRHVMKD